MLRNNFNYKNVTNHLNNLFVDLNQNIIKKVEESTNIKYRERKTNFIDALNYKFNYSVPGKSKEQVIAEINTKKNETTDRRSYDYREKQISVDIYNDIYNKVKNLYNKLMIIDDDKDKIIAVDGVFNNTNILNIKGNLETTLNLGIYDVTNDIPIDLTMEGEKDKKYQLECLTNYITNNKLKNNCILILDRAYCSYEFVNFLILNNFRFVIRFRNNCKEFNKIKKITDIRIIKYFELNTVSVPFDKYDAYINKKKEKENGKNVRIKKQKINTKKQNRNKKNNTKSKKENIKINTEVTKEDKINFKTADIIMKYDYILVTNLNLLNYDENCIKKLYKQRWDVEIFFKLLKYNFKFEHLLEHKNDDKECKEAYNKIYLVNMTIIYLAKIIEKTNFYNNNINTIITKEKNGKMVEYKNKANKSLCISGVYEILEYIFENKLTVEKLINITKNYVKYSPREVGLVKERKAKTPFFKWYVKGHSNRSLTYKLLEAKLTNDLSKLNKNHLVIYNICKIKLHY